METKIINTSWEYGGANERLTFQKVMFIQGDVGPKLRLKVVKASEVDFTGTAIFTMPSGETVMQNMHSTSQPNELVFDIPPVALMEAGEHKVQVELKADGVTLTTPRNILYIVNSAATMDCTSRVPESTVTYITDLLADLDERIESAKQEVAKLEAVVEDVGEEIANARDIVDGLVEKLLDTGSAQVDRINATASPIDSKLQMIWRMYSILTGSQRYLSGGVLEHRGVNNIEKTVDGGVLSQRVGEPKRIYNGGLLSNRTIKVPLTLDLGEFQ